MIVLNILFAVAVGIVIYLLIVILFSRSGEQRDILRRRIDMIDSKTNAKFTPDEEMGKPFSERFLKPIIRSLAKKIGSDTSADAKKNRQANLQKKMLYQAGFTFTPAEFGIIKLLVISGTAILLALIILALSRSPKNALLGAAAGLFIGYTGMRFFLTSAIKKRKSLMERQLPDVLDLLSVSVEAGLGFEQAISHIISNMEGPLIDEFTVTSREMSMGRPRRDALMLLGERCEIEEIKSFAGALAQASQLGISIKNVLRSQASAMRQARRAKVQEKAMKVSVKMLFPMVAFIFPVIFIMLLGPAIVNVLKIFAG
ncbi:type II secretion system F family protein [Oscillospiraceae bacterium WX1]